MASSTLLPSRKATQNNKPKKQIPGEKQQQKSGQCGGKANYSEEKIEESKERAEEQEEDAFQTRPRQKAIDSLEPVLHILERFHHRNKNQHRRSKWWSLADMLRRQVRKFIEALYDGLEEEERDNRILARAGRSGTPATKIKGKGKNGKVDGLEDGLVKDKFGIYERGAYLRGVLVPRAWFAFSQVVADQQFAHLGLMLLATLAQVDRVVSAFAPGPGLDEESGDGLDDSLGSAENQEIPLSRETIANEEVVEDVGVAISREEFLMMTMFVRTGGGSAYGGETRTGETTVISKTATVETDGEVYDDDDEFEGFDDDPPDSILDHTSTTTEAHPEKGPATAIVEEEEEEEEAANTIRSTAKAMKKKRPRDEEEEEQLSSREGIDDDDDIGNIFASLVPTKKKKPTKATATGKGRSFVSSSTLSKARVEEEPSGQLGDGKGDDIGDIFSSLMPKTKKKKSSTSASASVSAPTTTTSKIKSKSKDKANEKKQKEKRQGDEFDDIFGGLL